VEVVCLRVICCTAVFDLFCSESGGEKWIRGCVGCAGGGQGGAWRLSVCASFAAQLFLICFVVGAVAEDGDVVVWVVLEGGKEVRGGCLCVICCTAVFDLFCSGSGGGGGGWRRGRVRCAGGCVCGFGCVSVVN
jgi:hypothetical protein